MELNYIEIHGYVWNYGKNMPKCPDTGSFKVIYSNDTYWIVDSKIHRTNGPAIIYENGEEEYYIDNLRHREDGPAFISPITQMYFQHGKLHREDGPAICSKNEFLSSNNFNYWLFGKNYPKEEWELKVEQLNLKEQIL